MSSSKYNEAFYEKHKDKIGSNVVASLIIQYTKCTPCEGGMDLISVTCMDPAGMIPGFLKTKMSGRMGM